MPNLTKKDYITVLNYYKQTIPTKAKTIKQNAEKILRDKLCRCIKKVDKTNEARSIGICTRSVFNKKGLTRGKFNCTGKDAVINVTKMKKNNTRKNNTKK